MKTNKMLKVLTTSALLASLAAPFAAPVSANSTNTVDRIVSATSNSELNGASLLYVNEDDTQFNMATQDTFRVSLPTGAKWDFSKATVDTSGTKDGSIIYLNSDKTEMQIKTGTAIVKAVVRNEKDLEVTPLEGFKPDTKEKIAIPLYVKLEGADGEVKLRIDRMDSTVDSGEYVFARVSSGATKATADEIKSIGKSGAGARIRIEENALGALYGNQDLKLKLPSNFKWDMTEMNKTGSSSPISLGGEFSGASFTTKLNSDNELVIQFTNLPKTDKTRGYIYITPHIKANSDAAKGTVNVSISGGDFSDADVAVAKYGDYAANLKVEKVEELVAGKFDEYTRTAKITIQEDVPNTFLGNRDDIEVQFPSWVKVVDVSDWSVSGPVTAKKPEVGKDKDVDGKDDKFGISIKRDNNTSSTTAKIEFKVRLSVEANKAGDIEATVKGGGLNEQKLVVAKAIAPGAATVEKAAKLKIGAQDQEGPVIFITEAKKGVFEKNTESGRGNNGEIVVKLADGVKFSKVPKVEVVEGDGTIDSSNIRRINNDNQLAIPVKGESTSKPMKLKISDVRLTLDRNVPEGKIEAKLGGSAVVENYNLESDGWIGSGKNTSTSDSYRPGTFNTANAVTFTIGDTVTPAPGETTAQNIVFKIGQKSYTVNGETRDIDVAPYVHPVYNRTYVPVSHFAASLNIAPDKVVWNEASKTVTVFSGSTVITATAGKKEIVVNGSAIPTDAPVMYGQHTGYRVLVPYTHLAVALGAKVEWKADTQEILVNK
ncbi:copper amine oxidase N-terminal domain-containing protein [Aneurinibacillus aneurinilyticus]|uniref:copper amine oxidase N-terminal domain-containing protein n=1 Tax=Aneurinibacillus aneurinilyticus TaxID=1391 RepID=UPI002E2302C3|nr:copper amine oxidase N-terminal domain-containing protein [Aneurinibacillus aneurinilyticus]